MLRYIYARLKNNKDERPGATGLGGIVDDISGMIIFCDMGGEGGWLGVLSRDIMCRGEGSLV